MLQAAQTVEHIPELDGPDLPEEVEYIFDLWKQIYQERDNSLSVQLIKVRDIMAWASAYNVTLTPFEIDCLTIIDQEYVAAHGHS